MAGMDIHQMQVRYDASADRILWQVRTRGGELFGAWLTRRMLLQWWPRFQDLVGQTSLPHTVNAAAVVPEAREMLTQVARERPLPNADFKAPFNTEPAAQPMGAEPMLPTAIEMGLASTGHNLLLRLRDAQSRSLSLQLTPDLSAALMRLIAQALTEAHWGDMAGTTAAAQADPPAARVLN
jgi:hypothetical protein